MGIGYYQRFSKFSQHQQQQFQQQRRAMTVKQRRGQQSPNKFDPKLEDCKGTKLVSKRFRQLLRRYHHCTIVCGIILTMSIAGFVGIILQQHAASLPNAGNFVLERSGGFVSMPFIDFGNFNLSLSNRISETMIDQIHVPAELSGCEPKLELEIYNQTWIFKPSQGLVNELVAYHLDKIFAFNRVPPVVLLETPFSTVKQALKEHETRPDHYFRCNMHLNAFTWVRNEKNSYTIGTAQLKVKGVSQRAEMDRFVNRLTGGMIENHASIFAQRERNTRALFDYLVGNWDRYNNDFILQQPSGARVLVYLDNNNLSSKNAPFPLDDWTKDCRFYHHPVTMIEELAKKRHPLQSRLADPNYAVLAVKAFLLKDQFFESGIKNTTLNPTRVFRNLKHLKFRMNRTLERVKDCVEQHGSHYVFGAI